MGLEVNTPVYYIQNLVHVVFTEPLKAQKGSDASNLHDEEVGENEAEFSDDEKEAEHKRLLKKRKSQANDSVRKSGKSVKSDVSNQRHYSTNQNPAGNNQAHNYQLPQQSYANGYDQYNQYYYQMMQAGFNQYSGQVYNYQNNPYGYMQGMYNPTYPMGSHNQYMQQQSGASMHSGVNHLQHLSGVVHSGVNYLQQPSQASQHIGVNHLQRPSGSVHNGINHLQPSGAIQYNGASQAQTDEEKEDGEISLY